MTTQHHNAHRYGDQMQCSHCGKAWDVNDPEPPPCEVYDRSGGLAGIQKQMKRHWRSRR